MSRSAAAVTSSMARLNAASFAREGRAVPLSLRTNCSAEARISSAVAGGAKFASVLMFLHMRRSLTFERNCRRDVLHEQQAVEVRGKLQRSLEGAKSTRRIDTADQTRPTRPLEPGTRSVRTKAAQVDEVALARCAVEHILI